MSLTKKDYFAINDAIEKKFSTVFLSLTNNLRERKYGSN